MQIAATIGFRLGGLGLGLEIRCVLGWKECGLEMGLWECKECIGRAGEMDGK